MGKEKFIDRLEFLAKKFDIFETEGVLLEDKVSKLIDDGWEVKQLVDDRGNVLALIYNKDINGRIKKNVSVSLDVFSSIIEADPTTNKSCVQWMLNVFVRYLLDGQFETAIRFVVDDLPMANEYIKLFEANKNKKKFSDFCSVSYLNKHIKTPTDINQYKSLSQLFDAVDPFIKRDPSEMESLLLRFVDLKEAIIPIRDRKFTVYIPLSLDASVAFNGLANWCTAIPGNGRFKSYTTENKKPNGKDSNLYIIINNKLFQNESNEIYQIHFETNQIKDRNNASNVNIFESVISQSEALSNYFYNELIGMAKGVKSGIENNKYIDYLVKFGFCESLFEILDETTPIIKFMGNESKREIPRLPDMSRFKQLGQLILVEVHLTELHESIGKLDNLELLILTNNNIKSLPIEIGMMRKLIFLNIIGNKIDYIPDEIKWLDKSNGGSLFRIAVKKEDIGEDNYRKLKRLLPNVLIS
jgi:hypothetical protein